MAEEVSAVVTSDDNKNIRTRIANYSKLEKNGLWSSKEWRNGFPWQVCIKPNIVAKTIDITLYTFKDEESNVWFCDASMECTFINQNQGGADHKLPQTSKHRFTQANCETGLKLVHSTANLFANTELGFLKDDIVILDVCIFVHSMPGKQFRNKIIYNMFNPSPTSDGILIVEQKKLFVSKQILAIHSPFFEKIFYGQFKEATLPESKILGVSLDEFVVLLKMLYKTGESFTVKNVEFILKLADRFGMMSILDDAENYLMGTTNLDLHKKFRLSDQYNLFVLRDQLLPQYTAPMIRAIKKLPEYNVLKEETKDLLFEKYLEFTTPK